MLTKLRNRLMTRMMVLALMLGTLMALVPGVTQAAKRREQHCAWMTCYDVLKDPDTGETYLSEAYDCYICI